MKNKDMPAQPSSMDHKVWEEKDDIGNLNTIPVHGLTKFEEVSSRILASISLAPYATGCDLKTAIQFALKVTDEYFEELEKRRFNDG